jgi:hypothetical protein
MTKKLITLSLAIFLSLKLLAQERALQVNKINLDTLNYQSYVSKGNTLFAINKKGKLRVWDLNKFDTILFTGNKLNVKYTAVAKDVHDNIFISSADGSVFKLSSDNYSLSLYLKIKRPIQSLVFNSKNKLFLVTPYGVYDTESKRYWDDFTVHAPGFVRIKKKLIFFKGKIKGGYFSSPQFIYLDKQDRLWMSASYGEFGTDMEIFDTDKKQILDSLAKRIRNEISNPNSFFNDDHGNFYITSGLQHFMNWGNITKVDKENVVKEMFDGKANNTENRMFIGPGAYNPVDNCIYFASTDGFFKTPLSAGNFSPQFLFRPSLSWSNEPMAIGASMAVKKVGFINDNKMLFLTTNDGFVIYDGKKLTVFK